MVTRHLVSSQALDHPVSMRRSDLRNAIHPLQYHRGVHMVRYLNRLNYARRPLWNLAISQRSHRLAFRRATEGLSSHPVVNRGRPPWTFDDQGIIGKDLAEAIEYDQIGHAVALARDDQKTPILQ